MGTAVKHPVADQVKLLFVIFDIRALWCSAVSVRARASWHRKHPVPYRLTPVWHRMPY